MVYCLDLWVRQMIFNTHKNFVVFQALNFYFKIFLKNFLEIYVENEKCLILVECINRVISMLKAKYFLELIEKEI